MDRARSLYLLGLPAVLGALVGFLTPGCHTATPGPNEVDPWDRAVLYPAPPEQPRLQFLTSFSVSTDLGTPAGRRPNGFETFVFGKVEESVDWIAKPYGIDIDDGKLYVCDVQKRAVAVLDLRARTFGTLTEERRMTNPVNLCIADGVKYVADSVAGRIFVFDRDNTLRTILGRDLDLKPIDVAVRETRCYVTDMTANQVVVLDTETGEVIRRMGSAGDDLGQFVLIGDLALDTEENVYVTDKLLGRVTIFNREGVFQRSFGHAGDSIHNFVRPKGIDVDRDGRLWIVDAAPEVVKIYDREQRLLMFFGFPGSTPGHMNMPVSVLIDYDHVPLFASYALPGAEIDFLVFVTNQYGPKVNVYGFGTFPTPPPPTTPEPAPSPHDAADPNGATPPPVPASPAAAALVAAPPEANPQDIADLYYRSMHLYRNGRYAEARPGLVQVLGSGQIPPQMAESIRLILTDIDSRSPQPPTP